MLRTMQSFLLICTAATFFSDIACFASSSGSRSLRGTDPCSETKRALVHTRLNHSVPHTAVLVRDLKICAGEYSCCTSEMEENLVSQSNLDFERNMEGKCTPVRNLFDEQHEQFNKFFLSVIDRSRTSLDKLFSMTYGIMYQENSAVFMELFDNLASYYRGDAMDVSEIFDNFFAAVMQKVFKLQHPSFILNEAYMTCIAESIHEIRPFGDLPAKMSAQLYPTEQCKNALTKMSYCSKCQGIVSVKPCHGLCMNVMNGCLHDYGSLNFVWNEYIDVMRMMLTKLNDPFNFESVLDRLDIKISESIMVLQDDKASLEAKVYNLCGFPQSKLDDSTGMTSPSSGPISGVSTGNNNESDSATMEKFRLMMESMQGSSGVNNRRDGLEFDLDLTLSTSGSTGKGRSRTGRSIPGKDKKRSHRRKKGRRKLDRKHVMRPSPGNTDTGYTFAGSVDTDMARHAEAQRDGLPALVEKMHSVLSKSENHWINLPTAVCADLSEMDESAPCWNGIAEGRYQSPIKKGAENPEIDIGSNHAPDHVIGEQIAVLRNTIFDLKTAHRGMDPSDVDVEANENSGYSGSGEEGSGEVGKSSDADGANDSPQDTIMIGKVKSCPGCGGAAATKYSLTVVLGTALIAGLLH